MSRSNYDKPFYVDVGTSIVAIRCASNHDVVVKYDHELHPCAIKTLEDACDRMNEEAEIGKPLSNCDVGTAHEQIKRHEKWCNSDRCVYKNCVECFAEWSHMPYKDGETK